MRDSFKSCELSKFVELSIEKRRIIPKKGLLVVVLSPSQWAKWLGDLYLFSHGGFISCVTRDLPHTDLFVVPGSC